MIELCMEVSTVNTERAQDQDFVDIRVIGCREWISSLSFGSQIVKTKTLLILELLAVENESAA